MERPGYRMGLKLHQLSPCDERVRLAPSEVGTRSGLPQLCIINKSSLNMNLRSFALLTVMLLPFAGMAQCSGNFTYQVNGNTVVFDGMITPAPGPNMNYYWWFSDNNTYATTQDPTHTFSAPGIYTVCFSFYDVAAGCSDSLCQIVQVGNPSSCNADFTWIDTLGYTYFMGTTTAGAGAMYFWDFGDGNYSNLQNPSNQYQNGGTYLVCLTVYDSMQNFCDSTCHYVIVQGAPPGCNADFTWVDTVGYCFFTSYSTLGNGGSYYWDFGDGNYSTQINPSHQYASPGYYTVCLVVYDSAQNFCDSTCHTILTQVAGVENEKFTGSMTVSPNPANDVLHVSFNAMAAGEGTITFYDATGRLTNEENITVHAAGNVNTDINMANMTEGVYLMKVEVNGLTAWKRIALTHQ